MKRKPLYLSIFFSILITVLFIVYKVNNFNALVIDTITLPQTEKFDAKIYKIDKYKIWEMKNVYLYDGDQLFKKKKDGKRIANRFYMVNKPVQNTNVFFNKFIKLTDLEECEDDEYFIAYYFYLESKKLPKYWKPIWNRRCIDELTQHDDDLLFIITTDINKNILSINIL